MMKRAAILRVFLSVVLLFGLFTFNVFARDNQCNQRYQIFSLIKYFVSCYEQRIDEHKINDNASKNTSGSGGVTTLGARVSPVIW